MTTNETTTSNLLMDVSKCTNNRKRERYRCVFLVVNIKDLCRSSIRAVRVSD
jgi:hypothetical protein